MPVRFDLSGPWSVLSRAPMVRLTLPVIIGMAWAGAMSVPILIAGAIFLLATLVASYFLLTPTEYRSRGARGIVTAIWMLAFGFLWMTMRDGTAVPQSIHYQEGNEGPWLVRTTTLNRVTDTQLRADAQVIAFYEDDVWVPVKGNIMLTALRNADDPLPRVGDRMLVEAPMKRIARIADPGGFDRQIWAAARGIELELFATWYDWKRIDHTTTWVDHFSNLRRHLANWVDAAELNEREQALVKALVLGQRDELDSEQRTAFARSGTIHVLAVSGMHVGLIYAILTAMFSGLGRRTWARVVRGVLILVTLWIYAGITGAAPSILRATVMFSFITLADMTARRTDHFNSLFAAIFLLLLWDPRMLGLIGFQLSFLAVLGIILFFKPLEELWTPRTWIMRKMWSLAVLSVAAQSLTTPVSLYYFKAFPLWFLPANLIVVTAVVFSVWSSIALIILHKIPIISSIIAWVLTMLLKVVTWSTSFFAALPYSYPSIRIGVVMVILLYVMVLSIAAWWLWKWRSMRWVIACTSILLLLVWANNARSVNQSSTFTLYDERKGIMAGITKGREHVVLVDPDRAVNDPFIVRKIEQHQKAIGLKQIKILPPTLLRNDQADHVGSTVAAGDRWRNEDFDVLFVNDEQGINIGSATRFDAIILHDLDRIPEELLTSAARSARHLVIAGKTNWRVRENAFNWCIERGIPVHDVFAQGAFIIRK